MFDGHNPLKYIDFETDHAVATWPAGADEFNRDYTMQALGDETKQIYCDGGWVTSNQGYQNTGFLGMTGEKVQQEGNRQLFFQDQEHPDLETSHMIFTGPEFYNQQLPNISGEPIQNTEQYPDKETVKIIENTENTYQMLKADKPEDINEEVIAFGKAEAFNDNFPLITLENGRDSYMALAYDEQYQEELQNKQRQMLEHLKNAENKLEQKYHEQGEKGLEQEIAQQYHEQTGQYPEKWEADRQRNWLYPEVTQKIAERNDQLGEKAKNLQELRNRKNTLTNELRTRKKEELYEQHLHDTFYQNVIQPSSQLQNKAEQHGENYLAVHDIHDLFNDLQAAKFDNPRLTDSQKMQAVYEAAQKEFEHVEVQGIPWSKAEDGKTQTIVMNTELKEQLPTFEDLIPEEKLPPARSSKITSGTPYRPVMMMSDQPIQLQREEELKTLTPLLE